MKQKLLIFFLLLSSVTFAQKVTVTARQLLPASNAYYPHFNEQGTLLLYTGDSFTGLRMYDFVKGQSVVVSNEAYAGYEPRFSNDDTHIYYRRSKMEYGRKYLDLLSYNASTKQVATILVNQRQALNFDSYCESGILMASENKLKKVNSTKAAVAVPAYACSENLELVLYQNGQRTVLKPISGDVAGYIWVSMSPDNTHILFTAAGHGTYVCNLDGKIVASFGTLNAPVWYGNDFIVGMVDKDNGEVVTSSEVLLCSLNGQVKQLLSTANEIAMNPTAAVNANKVAYNTYDGKVVVVTLKIKR